MRSNYKRLGDFIKEVKDKKSRLIHNIDSITVYEKHKKNKS